MNSSKILPTPDFFINNQWSHARGQSDLGCEIGRLNFIDEIKEASNLAIRSEKMELENNSADLIKRFFRKVIAAQSYYKMFSNGTYFKEIGNELPKISGTSSFASLTHLDKISARYLAQIKAKTPDLSSEEKGLLKKVLDSKLIFRHQSNSPLAEGGALKIFSNDYLSKKGRVFGGYTKSLDKICLHNHDFVFFGVEFSRDLSQAPLNSKHATVDFGANAYLVEDQYRHGYLTLTDHFDSQQAPFDYHEHQDFAAQFPGAKYEVYRRIHGDKGVKDVPVYNKKDMQLALGLHLINFIRSSEDPFFKEFSLKADLKEKELDRIINFVFQPEFHVPRMVATTRFKEVILREISPIEAVAASNLIRIDELVKNKDDACKVMGLAIVKAKKDIVDYLISKWEFSYEDVKKMKKNSFSDDIEYSLSESSANTEILGIFLEKGWVDANTIFNEPNRGDTMLDNAIRYKKMEMIGLLTKYGALTGKQLKNK